MRDRLRLLSCHCPNCRLIALQPQAWNIDIIGRQTGEREQVRRFATDRDHHLLIHAMHRWVFGVECYAIRSTADIVWSGLLLTAHVRSVCPSHNIRYLQRSFDKIIARSTTCELRP